MQEYILEGNRKRSAILVTCDYCEKEFLKQTRFIKQGKNNYCSRSCSSESNKTGVALICAHCKKSFYRKNSALKNSKNNIYFCSRKCKDEGQKYIKEIQPEHYGTATEGSKYYRRLAFEAYEAKCNICGYNNIGALEVHHKDKNRKNNSIDNLRILCSNCHVLLHKGLVYG